MFAKTMQILWYEPPKEESEREGLGKLKNIGAFLSPVPENRPWGNVSPRTF